MAAQVLPAIADTPRGKHITRDEVHRLESLGLLTGRYELIEGELVDKMGQNPPHGYVLTRVMIWLASVFGRRVRCQLPIEVAHPDQQLSEPQPDIALLAKNSPEYYRRLPRGDELALVIEISDSSSRFDLTKKARLYARAEVREYWVVDIPRGIITIHRRPMEGAYGQLERLGERDSLTIEGASIPISELLSPELD
jgi:Uma2 family endonuclease